MSSDPPILLGPEVALAFREERPVVALESTLITHGLPWPQNLDSALTAQASIRARGAVPATIAVLHGQIRVGMSDDELHHLAESSLSVKASRRDLSAAVAFKANAATTVSATLAIMPLCGIRVMATGGLGGVHRGAKETFDISADIDDLARARGCVVVCSGAKSILDLPATLELLESRGVLVVGYRTQVFPAFTSRDSGLRLDWRVESADEVAVLWKTHCRLGAPGAIILAQPVPTEAAIEPATAENALDSALNLASTKSIRGKEVTPFLLEAIRTATEGLSVQANHALILSNAALAAEVAITLNSVRDEMS